MKMSLLLLLIFITPLFGEWECEVVESLGIGGTISLPYIGVDTLGRVHIGYFAGGKLHYAFKENGTWVIDSSEPAADGYNGYNDMVIDPGGNPHYFYTKRHIGYDQAHYAKRNEDGTWEEEEIPVQGSESYTIAVDKNSVPHVVFEGVYDYFYGYKDSHTGKWNLEPFSHYDPDTTNIAYGPLTIALDKDGFPHLSCLRLLRDLYHIYYDGFGWHFERADTSSLLSWIYLTNLAIDSMGYPHIVYAKDLWDYAPSLYVHKTDTGWVIEDISHCGAVVASFHRIALDSLNHPHIICLDHGVFGRYAYFDGKHWHYNDLPPPPLDTLPVAFGTQAIAIDKNGTSHVVLGNYWDDWWGDTIPGYVLYCHGTPTGVKEENSPVKSSGTNLKITPNPSSGPFSIELTNNTETTLRLKILDIQGRKVKSLGSIKRKGRHNVIWDARDDRGKDVPKGVYFLMIKGTKKTIVKRLVLVK